MLCSFLRAATVSSADFIVDIDHLEGTYIKVDDFLMKFGSDGLLLVLKTHKRHGEFCDHYTFLLDSICCEINIFRTPLDVAVSTHNYIDEINNIAPDQRHPFATFFHRWVSNDGNSDYFGHFPSWLEYAAEALCPQPAVAAERIFVTYDDI